MSHIRRDLDAGRVLRVTVPVRQHIQLHKLRLLVGKNMSDVVVEALDMYFAAFNASSTNRALAQEEERLPAEDGAPGR